MEELTGQRKEEAEDDDMDWDEEVLGEMEGGYDNRRFSSYWNSDNDMTYPLILAKIPVKNPWELFAWLPFGNWNECPDTPELMAVAKYCLLYTSIHMDYRRLSLGTARPVVQENHIVSGAWTVTDGHTDGRILPLIDHKLAAQLSAEGAALFSSDAENAGDGHMVIRCV